MRPKRKSPVIRTLLLFALAATAFFCALAARASMPASRRVILSQAADTPSPAVATHVPSAMPVREPSPAPATPSPSPSPFRTSSPTRTPSPAATPFFAAAQQENAPLWIESTGQTQDILPVETQAMHTPVPMPTQTPLVPAPEPSPTPRPGPTPTYAHEGNGVRIEILRHEIKNVTYFTAEIWLESATQLQSAFSGDRFDASPESVEDIATRNSAILAINGDFATFNNGGIIIRNGELHRTNHSTRQMLVIDQHGDFIAYPDPPEDPEAAAQAFLADGIRHTLVFGPVLVSEGEAIPIPEKYFIRPRALEPRTAILQLGPLHYMFLVVDGRRDGYSQGVSLPRLQELCLLHNAVSAFNLDGGGSTTLFFDGEIINRPSNGGQRQVSDILYIGK